MALQTPSCRAQVHLLAPERWPPSGGYKMFRTKDNATFSGASRCLAMHIFLTQTELPRRCRHGGLLYLKLLHYRTLKLLHFFRTRHQRGCILQNGNVTPGDGEGGKGGLQELREQCRVCVAGQRLGGERNRRLSACVLARWGDRGEGKSSHARWVTKL